ncbi:MAG: hypothetical protein CEN91_397 [Candidatus Berkelbacteria bacterium Licking1014_85]|uniref:Uncharacterized protein n=1 Tax=Candidatus Berkelbacteria bacterium Licking1014_85 TaxID=2017148 RepID=A0A554LIB7_9BACT|nr:MAG: hypothetical protein CEN91_397 [Candidatus Berkelbacteria bacterium Licking1014_85]
MILICQKDGENRKIRKIRDVSEFFTLKFKNEIYKVREYKNDPRP